MPFSNAADQFGAAARFIRDGIQARERTLYVAPDSEHAPVRDELKQLGVDLVAAESSGAVAFAGAAHSYLRTGQCDLEDMLAFLENNAADARRSQYQGFRVFGNWVAEGAPDQLPEFESKLNLLAERLSISVFCAYHRPRLSGQLMREGLATHPYVLLGGRVFRNPHYVPPEAFLAEDRLIREVDWFLGNLEQSGKESVGAQEPGRLSARAAVDGEEAIRRAISLELHDDLGQTLTALHLSLSSAAEEGRLLAVPELAEDAALVGAALESVRRLALELRPSALDDLGLTAALRSLATEQSLRAGFLLEMRMPELDASSLEPGVALAAFRIVQQAINNVVQHAQAHSVTLTVEQNSDELQLSIRDDGKGFDPVEVQARQHLHLGLRGMSERAELLGGDLQVESSPGSGTVVRARLPTRRERPS